MTESRELTFDDVLQFAGVHEAQSRLERIMPDPATLSGSTAANGCGSGSCGCGGTAPSGSEPSNTLLDKPLDRRRALGTIVGALAVSTQAVSACSPASLASDEEREAKLLERDEYFKGNYRLMSPEERDETIRRLERLTQLRTGIDPSIRKTDAIPGVLYGYAFNISKCKGFRNCVQACIEENNLDRGERQSVHPDLREEGWRIDQRPRARGCHVRARGARRGSLLPGHAMFPMRQPSRASTCVRYRRPGRNPTASSSWTMTGVSGAGTAWRPVRIGPGASTGPNPSSCRGVESPSALLGQPGAEAGRCGEVHVLHSTDPRGALASVCRSLPDRSPRLLETCLTRIPRFGGS